LSLFIRQNQEIIAALSAMMPPGALTARLSGVPWKPARQIAATENLDGRARNGRF